MLSRSPLRPLVAAVIGMVVGLVAALGALTLLGAIAPQAPETLRVTVAYATWVLVAAAVIAVLVRVIRRGQADR